MPIPPAQPKRLELPKVGDTIEGRYKLIEALSSGGMGVVMRAEHAMMGREVAVKILHAHIAAEPGFTERFKREVRVSTLFSHPNITRVYDFGETSEGILYLVMELLEGSELKDVIAKEARLSVGRTFELGLQMLEGLAEAHSQGVVHRDLKPSNIFVVSNRRGQDGIKLLDFGIARMTDSRDVTLTGKGMIAGTPAYMAPEVLLGKAPGKGVDVYALGLILLEMLTGHRVFDGESMAQNLLMQLKKPVRIPDAIDRTPLGAVIRKATHKHPDDRYGDAEQMLEEMLLARASSPLELRLSPEQVPAQLQHTSSSLLEKMGHGDNSLSMLRKAPQHVAVNTAPPGRPITEMLSTRDVEFLNFVEEKTAQYSPETAVIKRSSTALRTALVEPSKSKGGFATVFARTGAVARESAEVDPKKQTDVFFRGFTPWAIGGIAVLMLLITLVLVWPGGAQQEGSSAAGEPEAAAQTALAALPEASVAEEVEELFEVHVHSIPEGARVFVDGESKGMTNTSFELQTDSLPLVLRLEHDGFETETLVLRAVPEEALVFPLRSSVVKAPQPAPAAPRRAKAPSSKQTKRAATSPESPPPSPPKEQDRIDSVLDRYLPEL